MGAVPDHFPSRFAVVCAVLVGALGLVHAGREAARAQQGVPPAAPASEAPPGVAGERAPEVAFVHIREGLPNPEVQALAQDADGLLWVGTADGLARYDGLRLTPVALADAAGRGLASRRVQRILAARSGAVWVGTDRGLARIDRRTDHLRVWPGTEPGSCTRDIVGLAEDAAGHILAGSSSGGLCRVDPQTGQVVRLPLPWGRASVVLLRGMPSGEVWAVGPSGPDGLPQTCRIATDGGPCRALDTGGFEPQALGLDPQGRLLALGVERRRPGAGAEIRRWGRGRFLPLHSNLPAFGRSPGSRLVVVGREAWVATSTDGVLAVDLETGAARTLTPDPAIPTSLPAHRVRALLGDRQGGVWVGTARGLARWHPPPRPFTLYRRTTARPGEISDDRVNGMTETRDGALWVTTNDGLNRLDLETDRFEVFRVENPATESDRYRDAWWQVLEGQDGTLWVGAKRNGLNRVDRRTGRFRRDADAARALGLVGSGGVPPGFGVRHLFEDRRGRLWLGTSGEGLAVRDMDTGLWRGLRPDPAAPERSLPHPSANRFFEDAEGQLWVGTDAGIARLDDADDGTVTATPVGLGREDEPVWSFAETPLTPGVLWVGSVGGGLVRYHVARDSVARLTEADGLPSDLVYGLLTDDRGLIWASTSRGLARLDPRPDATGGVRIDTYDEADGLPVEGFVAAGTMGNTLDRDDR